MVPPDDSPTWFATRLLAWAETLVRPMPWRGERDAYRIWLSEVILQQTRVAQGEQYYLRFLAAFPTVDALARAHEDAVLALWQGLGYYSRARNLHAAARQVVHEFGGVFPTRFAELIRLPGVGPYSAAAIASFSSDEAVAVVDGNVYRVLARVFGIGLPIDKPVGQREFRRLAEELLAADRSADYNQAIMDFGATVCTPRAPGCPHCPMQDRCIAWATGRVLELPVKAGQMRRRQRFLDYLHLVRPDGAVLLRRRGAGDIWQGLYDLPAVETSAGFAEAGRIPEVGRGGDSGFGESPSPAIPDQPSLLRHLFPALEGEFTLESISVPRRQQLTHQELIIRYWRYRWREDMAGVGGAGGPPAVPLLREDASAATTQEDFRWVSPDGLGEIGMPQPLVRYLADPELTLFLS